MHSYNTFLNQLHLLAKKCNHRFAVILDGHSDWQIKLLTDYIEENQCDRVIKIGGQPLKDMPFLGYKQGQALLGGERDVIIFDDSDGFDANSFTACTGSLVGGGILFLLLSGQGVLAHSWFKNAFSQLLRVSENQAVPLLPEDTDQEYLPYTDQNKAIQSIKQVVSGHRKRPLVITADRGRGKSSALGIAASELMAEKKLNILVTAPARKSVDPVFEHAKQRLFNIEVNEKNVLSASGSSIRFISPDELLRTEPECDLLFIDEASAIPIPLLISIVTRYHRTVFSTTVHGYEGCGRGFTIKFAQWLTEKRPGWKALELNQPIRWSPNDPLEKWLFDTFLLDADIFEPSALQEEKAVCSCNVSLRLITKEQCANDRELLKSCFGLLISAHYQTSPNDFIHLLQDTNTHLVVAERGDILVGCMLVISEGGMDQSLIEDICLGKRRPKGQLIATTLASQLCLPETAKLLCLRIMRIAVHPDMQGQGIGSEILNQLAHFEDVRFDYIATSFGVTQELFRFWKENGFVPLRLGSKRDQASGTHSVLMLYNNGRLPWINQAYYRFNRQLLSLLPECFFDLQPELIVELLKENTKDGDDFYQVNTALIKGYCEGATSYESAFLDIYEMLYRCLVVDGLPIHPILIVKFFQRRSWADVASAFHLTGRKQAEQTVKAEISHYLNLHCKLYSSEVT